MQEHGREEVVNPADVQHQKENMYAAKIFLMSGKTVSCALGNKRGCLYATSLYVEILN